MAEAPQLAAPPSLFARYWTAAAISSLGTTVTAVAMPVLVVHTLAATPFEVGLVNAAQFLPYAVLGLVAGVYVDRWCRRAILVWSSVGRAVSLAAVPTLWAVGALSLWALVACLLVFGACSVFGFAADQSLLPRLVPRTELVRSNARLGQTDNAASLVGPVLGGVLVGVVGAPVAIAVDAVSYLVAAGLNAGLRVEEPRSAPKQPRHLVAEIKEGVHWTYRHPVLGPVAASTHVWFLANSASLTALSVIALRTFGFSSLAYSLLLVTIAGAGLLGATVAPKIGLLIGAGLAIIAARAVYPVAWAFIALTLTAPIHAAALFVALALYGFAMAVENANEMGIWQGLTPDGLLGRVNGTRRSVNRTIAAVGSLAGGASLGAFGGRATIVAAVVVFGIAAAIAGLSPLRTTAT